MARILVVDDEHNILELIKFNLEREGYQVITATSGDAALELALSWKPDLIVLDVMLPGRDGLEVCRAMNRDELTRGIPIIMISARGEELDRVLGLELGADDYVTKPFSPRELVARVKARLRRRQSSGGEAGPSPSRRLVYGPLVIDQDRFEVTVFGVPRDLTPKEFELLRFLASEPGKVFSRDHLLERIWGYDYTGDTRTVDVHVRHLRQKLDQASDAGGLIETVRGIGYRFKEVKKDL
ncbi:MAG: response regulator transcription factor [Bacillota bacterium]|jgi:two-component system alkaline phosphatase synthesis response regulator PhoP